MALRKKVTQKAPASALGNCLALELALRQLAGSDGKWYGTAGTFGSPRAVRHALRTVAKLIRRRTLALGNVDARLSSQLTTSLDRLHEAAAEVQVDGRGLLTVCATLVNLVALLLGFDWHTGVPNRQLMYSQSQGQVLVDDRSERGAKVKEQIDAIYAAREAAILHLHSTGTPPRAIAAALNQSLPVVTAVISRNPKRGANSPGGIGRL
jgi:hypothetical protein